MPQAQDVFFAGRSDKKKPMQKQACHAETATEVDEATTQQTDKGINATEQVDEPKAKVPTTSIFGSSGTSKKNTTTSSSERADEKPGNELNNVGAGLLKLAAEFNNGEDSSSEDEEDPDGEDDSEEEDVDDSEEEDCSDDDEEEEEDNVEELLKQLTNDEKKQQGQDLLKQKDFENALVFLEDMEESAQSVLVLLQILSCYFGIEEQAKKDEELEPLGEEDWQDVVNYSERIIETTSTTSSMKIKPATPKQLVKAFFYLGSAHSALEDFENAVEILQKALKQDKVANGELLAPLIQVELTKAKKQLDQMLRVKKKEFFKTEEEKRKLERRKISGKKAFNPHCLKH
ncbi:unnamed protein product [Amoebophrya sp. A120]|nr:unnamed protein product [Amoebophrya sp. A120]|eukprot:GSA120T00019620001.1